MLTKWETLFLLIMTLPIMGHVVILPLMLDVAGRDSWISILLSLPVAMLLIFAILRLRINHPNMKTTEMFTYLLGTFFGKVLSFIFILYFLFLTILSFASLIDMVYIAFLPETPIVALILWFLIFFIFAALKGIKRIALIAGILSFIGLITGHTVTLMDSNLKTWGELLPILEFGWSPVMIGAFILISIWVELLLLLCVPLKNSKEKRMYLLWSVGVFLNALMMFSTTTGVITIFGLGQSDNFIYPALEIVRIINLGFIDRFDVYGLILMSFGVYIRCSLFIRIAYNLSVTPNYPRWIRGTIFSFLTLMTFLGTWYLTKEQLRIEWAINIYVYLIVLLPIPFLLLFISTFKKKKQTLA